MKISAGIASKLLEFFFTRLLSLILVLAGCSCFLSRGQCQTQAVKMGLPSGVQVLYEFTAEDLPVLKHYLSRSCLWDFHNESGKEVAVRKTASIDWKDKRNSVSFISDSINLFIGETIIHFGTNWSNTDIENATLFTNIQGKDSVNFRIGEIKFGTNNAFSSSLLFQQELFAIQINEISVSRERSYTEMVFAELVSELNKVYTNLPIVGKLGYVPFSAPCNSLEDSALFQVENGSQKGIYLLKGVLKTKEPGEVFVRVFELSRNIALSDERIGLNSRREIGWTLEPEAYYLYETELKIYEGASAGPYQVRFEVWFRNVKGDKKKLWDDTRIIKGWNRKDAYHSNQKQ